MTMFILAGGNDSAYPDYWQRLAGVIKRETANPTILSCLFARPEEARAEARARFGVKFREIFGEKSSVIFAEEENFYEQIARADVIYLHGGRTQLLKQAIVDVERFKQAISGKIIVGSSAGANFLSTACFSPSLGESMLGSGIVNVGVVVHYGAEQFDERKFTMRDWQEFTSQVANLSDGLSLLLLPEGEFSIVSNKVDGEIKND